MLYYKCLNKLKILYYKILINFIFPCKEYDLTPAFQFLNTTIKELKNTIKELKGEKIC